MTSDYAATVSRDAPAAWWRMTAAESREIANAAAHESDTDAPALTAHVVGDVMLGELGPSGEEFPDFRSGNMAIALPRGRNYLRVSDPGAGSPLDFDNGDTITIEAWVRPDASPGLSYSYIVGKGRTQNPGFSERNQNYSLRLANGRSGARLSFFFVDAETPPGGSGHEADGHRWTSTAELPLDGRWHHVALTYTFGEPDSLRGYINGEETPGKWDLAGKTKKRPAIDDDELWIGSSMKGRATLPGAIDEVAIYRHALSADSIARHARIHRRDEILAAVRSVADAAPTEHVQYDVFEGVGAARNWNFRPGDRLEVYQSDVFALTELPRKYDDRAVIVDRPTPLLVHAYGRLALPAGEHQLLFRSLNGARLYIDDQLVAENPFLPSSGNGHGKVYQLEAPSGGKLSLPAAHHETIVTFVSDGSSHVFSVMAIAGLDNRPAELGEIVVAHVQGDEQFQLLGTAALETFACCEKSACDGCGPEDHTLDDEGWLAFLDRDRRRRLEWEAQQRAMLGAEEAEYWHQRHAWVREQVGRHPAVDVPDVDGDELVNNAIDRFIQRRLDDEGTAPTPIVDDLAFLRRVTLDVIGLIPTPAMIERFLADPPEQRRQLVIDRLLDGPGWADHWVGYWQDVLAENPGLTKPTLNNSGPFRWFLYESFLDNKPFDRLVTELIAMEGGQQSGGPGGFAMATNNDSPMAHKAHIVATAFLGVEMKCARCHDSPTHESTQRDLFSLAAMLSRKPLAVPPSSTVPGSPEQLAHMAVTVSLEPGVPIEPAWPFEALASFASSGAADELLRKPNDSRRQLAWSITHPDNERFAKVTVNRLWQRYLGRGIVEPVGDWEMGEPSHGELLAFLARELVLHDYDLKHLARLILSSQAYQRSLDTSDERDAREALFAAPTRRRMTAEQLADSIFQAAGKAYDVEELCVNPDGRQAASNFLNLGTPQRAWEFACTSNERERPSMTLPRAQSVVDLMMAYGWRQNRQEPVSERTEGATPLTPLALANGVAVNRAVDLSDDGELVDICLAEQPVEQLVDRLLLRFYSRPPTDAERERYVALLSDGYAERRTGEPRRRRTVDRSPLAWSNNLDADANRIGEERLAAALEGDAPTRRLRVDWRERVEDMVWVLVNSPEFVFVP